MLYVRSLYKATVHSLCMSAVIGRTKCYTKMYSVAKAYFHCIDRSILYVAPLNNVLLLLLLPLLPTLVLSFSASSQQSIIYCISPSFSSYSMLNILTVTYRGFQDAYLSGQYGYDWSMTATCRGCTTNVICQMVQPCKCIRQIII